MKKEKVQLRDLDGNGGLKDVRWRKKSVDRHILVLSHVFWALHSVLQIFNEI